MGAGAERCTRDKPGVPRARGCFGLFYVCEQPVIRLLA
jgi:hypothetical protein